MFLHLCTGTLTTIIPLVTLLLYTPPATSTRHKIRILTIEVTDGFTFAVDKIGPAVRLALERSQQLYNDSMELIWEFRPGACGPELVAAQAAEVYYTTGFDVFIGPACSKAVEVLGYLANSWNLPIITPMGRAESVGDKGIFPRVTRVARLLQAQFIHTILLLMDHYNWTNVVIFNDQDTIFHELLGITVDVVLEGSQRISWTRYPLRSSLMGREDYRRFLITARPLARVIMVLAPASTSREVMLVAQELGYTNGEFVFFMITNPDIDQVTKDIWKQNDTEDEAARQAYESVIFLELAEDRKSKTLRQFKELMVKASLQQYNYSYDSTEPSTAVLQYYESVMLYTQVLNETLAAGEDVRDGLAMTQKMWNRTFEGLSGPLVINSKGDRVSDIAILDLNPETGDPEIVSIYRTDTRQMDVVVSRGIAWPNQRGPPLNEPVCGFLDEKCNFKAKTDVRVMIGVGGTFATLVVMGLFVFIVLYGRWRRVSEANLWWWKISTNDLTINDRPTSGSFGSLHSVLQQAESRVCLSDNVSTCTVTVLRNTGVYKGLQVRLRNLAIKKPVVNRKVLHEFKLIREVAAPNLVRVLGACLDNVPPFVVTELCPKGSLQDLLGSAKLSLDTEFNISLANDIVSGLDYLHGSPIGHHGRLNSATCLIDNRFSVKLTDFGLATLLAQEEVDTSSQEYKRECLWKAPEILRGDAPETGTKEGDMYSFAIILSELVTRASPFERETDFVTLDEILERLRRGQHPGGFFRPSLEHSGNVDIFSGVMQAAWCEDPMLRPSASSAKKQIKSMAQKAGQSANLLDNLLRRMERYANNLERLVEEKTAELMEEKKKSEELLYQILPRDIADRLKAGQPVQPEQYDCVTIYFSDIVGFTTLSSSCTPIQVVDLLNDLYSAFDETLVAYDVYKVETIGDAYMVVSGLPHKNGNFHAQQVARLSLALRNVISVFRVRHRPETKLQLRIGLNSGPVCAGVVGLKMPRYCLFGDTVNTASRMESNGEGMKIHMSESTATILETFRTFDIRLRGELDIKGKGKMRTYWLIGEQPPASEPGPSNS